MDPQRAREILRLTEDANPDEIEAAKKRRVAALHPDKHHGRDEEIFEDLTREIIEAADTLAKLPPGPGSRPKPLRITTVQNWRDASAFQKAMLLAGFVLIAIIPVVMLLIAFILASRYEGK